MVCALTAFLALASVSALATSVLDRLITLDIPADTPLDDALIAWGTKVGVTVMVNTSTLENKTIHGVHGTLRAGDMLSLLLRDSGLSYTAAGGRIRVAPVASLVRSSQQEARQERFAARSESDYSGANGVSTDQRPGNPGQGIESAQGNERESANLRQLEEVVVTAQKRSERLIDVPISIQALSSEEIEQRQILDFGDLRFHVAGLSENEQSGYIRRIFLRGMSNSAGSNSALIGVYLDEADVTTDSLTLLNLNAYDMNRVEVLRGPQGTLYGNGAAGGVVRFVTNDPKLDQFDAALETDTEYTQGGAPGVRVNAMLNVPVIDDQLGVRLATTLRHDGGWIDQPAAHQVNINGKDEADVRLKALWTPSSRLTVTGLAEVQDATDGPNFGQSVNDAFTESFGLPYTPRYKSEFGIYNITMNADLGAVKLTNTSTYLSERDPSYDHSLIGQFAPPGTPLTNYYAPLIARKRSSFVEEFRIASPDVGRLQWTVGGVLRHYKLDNIIPVGYFAQGPAIGVPPSLDNTVPFPFIDYFRSNSWAAFGDLNYQVTGHVKLGVGLRYFEDEQKDTTLGQFQSGAFTAVSPRYYAELKITPRVNAYASASKGFRSGGFNAEGQPKFTPEKIWTYEGGVKFSNLVEQLSGTVAIFYTNYDGYQTAGIPAGSNPPIEITFNAGDAIIDGIEWDLDWLPANGWHVLLNGDYLHRYNFTRIYASAGSADQVGDPVDYVPGYIANAAIERDFQLGERTTSLFLEYNQQGPQHRLFRDTGPWFIGESQTVRDLNGRAEISLSTKMTVSIYVKNLLDKRALTSPYNINMQDNEEIRQRPRTVGLSYRVRF